jgi:hypothetical protein
MPLVLGRRVPHFPEIVEGWPVLAQHAVDVAVPLVEAAGAGVVPVNHDLESSSSRATGPSYQTFGRKVSNATATAGSPVSRATTSSLASSRSSRVASTAFPGVGVWYSRLNASSNSATLATSATVATRGVSAGSCSISAVCRRGSRFETL